MKLFLFAVCAVLAAPPVLAEGQEDKDGGALMEEGLQLFLEGLQNQMAPALEEFRQWADEAEPALRSFAAEMGPALRKLMDEVEDWSAYHPPEILPNGDIILRRKPDEPDEQETPPGTEI